MNRKNKRLFSTLFFALLCTLSMALTAWAGPGDGLAAEPENTGTSRVITAGAGEAATTTDTESAPTEEALETGTQGASLGMFTTTGYCNCSKCSGGFNMTYSGTVPKANHTLSADINHYPIGTKLMINGIIYTVEDIGSSVIDNKVDIYYSSHQEAVAHGMKQEEVFMVE